MFTEVMISDEGPGIPEEEHARIFQRFYRGKGNYSDAGAGIGLYLTREILNKEDGYIRVKSETGRGAAFSIYLRRLA